MPVRAMLRGAAISCVIALVVLSWIPHVMEVRTGMNSQLEHVLAYAGAALVVRAGFSEIRTRTLLIGFIILAGVLEIGQSWVPGRNAQFIDFASSSFGALTALAAFLVVRTLRTFHDFDRHSYYDYY